MQAFANASTPTLNALLPFAHAFGPALSASTSLFKDTTPVIKNQLRPYSVAVQPVAKALAPAAAKLRVATPPLTRSVSVLNSLFNTLAYQPHGSEQGYLFWGSWLSHIAQSLTNLQDAQGSMVRGLFMGTCSELQLFEVGLARRQSGAETVAGAAERAGLEQDRRQVLPHDGDPVNKQAPSPSRILMMVAFAGSCVGLLLFLWISFGGTVPLAPQGYRLEAEFGDAVQLAQQSDVRISGVSVGKVVSVSLDKHTGLTKAVLQLDNKYAPRPTDTRAILRQKSLLGETYIELTPGSQNAPKLPDGGTIPRGQISPTVQLDQILSTFDPATRRAFSTWVQQDGQALTGRGQQFNAAIGQLYPFATNVEAVLNVLNRDDAATSALLSDGGRVFGALAKSPAQLQGLIRNSNAVFASTAARNQELAAAIKAFPAFTVATRQTVDRVHEFARVATPLINELRPAARQLNPTLQQTVVLAPELQTLLENLRPAHRRLEGRRARVRAVPGRERPVARTAEALPRKLRADLQLHQHLPARDRSVLRQQHCEHGGHSAEHHADQASALPQDLQPGQPGGSVGLSEPVGQQPREPVHVPGRLQPAAERPVGFRGICVHLEPPADDRADGTR